MQCRTKGSGARPTANGVSNIATKSAKRKPTMTPQQSQMTSPMTSRIPGLANHDRCRQRRTFPTDYCGLVKRLTPNVPASLLRGITSPDDHVTKRKDNPGPGKVKIMLRVSTDHTLAQQSNQQFLRVEGNKKHVSVFVPHDQSNQNNVLAPKVYAFDSVFTEETTQSEICSASLGDVIQAVLQGADGTVFCYGQSNLGKTFVLLGKDRASHDIGVLPCAISWLYRCINEMREQQGTRTSVRVSAIEVYGRSEKLRDLLAGYCEDGPSSALCVDEDPLMGTQLQNQCEIRANSAERAAYLLDAALASRSCSGSKDTPEARRHSHMVFTLHLYHHKTEKGESGVNGSRSRLHFIDLGSCEKTLIKTTNSLALSLSSLGHVIMSIVNNSKHVPFRESKLTCVLRDALGNVNCRAVMLAHVSRDVIHYSDTLSTIQMASRIHRVLKKKNKSSAVAESRNYNGVDSHIHRSKHLRQRSRDEESVGSSSGMECTSGSELSCDTVVYVNKKGVPMSDRELTDNEGPPEMVPIRMKPKIPPIISEASPPEEGEMVYNIAQAKVHKLGSEQTTVTKVGDKNATAHNRTGLAPSSQQTKVNKTNGSVKSNAVSNKAESRLPRNGQKTNQARSNIRKPSTSSNNSSSNLKAPAVNRARSAKNSTKNEEKSPTQAKLSSPQYSAGQLDNKKPAKPPRINKTNQPDDAASRGSTASSGRTNRQSSLPKPRKSSTQTPPSKTTSKVVGQQLPKQAQRSRNPPSIPVRSSSQRKENHDYVNIKPKTPVYENIPPTSNNHHYKYNGQAKFSAISQPQHKDSFQIQNNCYENVIPSVQEYTEAFKAISTFDRRKDRNQYENVTGFPAYPTPQDERPDPVGCAFESGSDKTPASSESRNIKNALALQLRPDSMFVNLDEEDWGGSGEDDNDHEAVDVNFYCLAFTTRNPLIPMTKSKFSEQIRSNKKRKSFSEYADHQTAQVRAPHEGAEEEQNSVQGNPPSPDRLEAEMSSPLTPLTREDTFVVNEEEDRWAWSVHDPEILDNLGVDEDVAGGGTEDIPSEEEEVADFDISDIKEMPKLSCSYASENGSNPDQTGSLARRSISTGSERSSAASSTNREVCLYDSNSLEMSYVSTKQLVSSSYSSPSRDSSSSQSPNRRGLKDSAVRRRTSRPVVMTKSTSKEGARLTLVKKHRSGGPTLELLITNEEDGNCKKSPSQRERKFGVSVDPASPEAKHSKNKKQTSAEKDNSKKLKWPGLRRFSSKKSNSKTGKNVTVETDQSKTKPSLVSKILTPKCERAAKKSQVKENKPDILDAGRQETNICQNGTKSRVTINTSQPVPIPTKRKESMKSLTGSPSARFGFSRKSKGK